MAQCVYVPFNSSAADTAEAYVPESLLVIWIERMVSPVWASYSCRIPQIDAEKAVMSLGTGLIFRPPFYKIDQNGQFNILNICLLRQNAR
jgi:hypothetical protein